MLKVGSLIVLVSLFGVTSKSVASQQVPPAAPGIDCSSGVCALQQQSTVSETVVEESVQVHRTYQRAKTRSKVRSRPRLFQNLFKGQKRRARLFSRQRCLRGRCSRR